MKHIPAYILFGAGLLLLGIAWIRFQKMRRFLAIAEFTTGTVVRNVNTSEEYFTPVIAYTNSSGKDIEFSPNMTTDPPFFKSGDKVKVAYTAAHAKIVDYWFMLLVTFVIAAVGLLLTIIGLGYFITMRNLSVWAGQ